MGSGADRADMDVDAVRRYMGHVADVGREIGTGWAARRAELSALEPGIGSGLIGAAIRAAYDGPSQVVGAAVEQLPELYTAMSDAGLAAADAYLRGDQSGAGAISGAGGGTGGPGGVDPRRL